MNNKTNVSYVKILGVDDAVDESEWVRGGQNVDILKKTPVFISQGFPDTCNNQRQRAVDLNRPVYCFGFKDCSEATGVWTAIKGLFRANLGQKGDIITALSALKHVYDAECKKSANPVLHTVAHSRGAGCFIGVLATLSGIHAESADILSKAKVTIEEQKKIKEMLERGRICLHCPLLSLSSLHWIQQAGLQIATNASIFAPSAYDLLKTLVEKHNFKIDIVLARRDVVVGHKYDADLKTLAKEYPKLIIPDDCWSGHNSFNFEYAKKLFNTYDPAAVQAQ